MEISETDVQKLVRAALDVRKYAYAPYSSFQVGAAALVPSGEIYSGCNVENASYGLAICAERSAITALVAHGEREIKAMAVACTGGGTPCGACRQVMAEFGKNSKVYLIDAASSKVTEVWTIDDLLPNAFRLDSLR